MSGLSDADREALHQVYADDRFFDDYVVAVEAIVARAVNEALTEAANDPALRLSGHSGISIQRLRARGRTT